VGKGGVDPNEDQYEKLRDQERRNFGSWEEVKRRKRLKQRRKG
jgi:hypothetical protein